MKQFALTLFALCLLCMSVLVPRPGMAEASPGLRDLLSLERRGPNKNDARLQYYIRWLHRRPRTPHLLLVLSLISRCEGLKDHTDALRAALLRVAEHQNAPPANRFISRLTLLRYAAYYPDHPFADRFDRFRYVPATWWIRGPYGSNDTPPSRPIIRSGAAAPPRKYSREHRGSLIPLMRDVYPRRGRIEAVSFFQSQQPESAVLVLQNDSSFRLRINGSPPFVLNRQESRHPERVFVPFTTRKGLNRISLVTSAPYIHCYLASASYGALSRQAVDQWPGPRSWKPAPPLKLTQPLTVYYKEDKIDLLLAKALVYDYLDLDVETIGLFDTLLRRAPRDPRVLYHYALTLTKDNIDYLPKEYRQQRRQMVLRRLRKTAPDFSEAAVLRAERLIRDDKAEDAVALLRPLVVTHPRDRLPRLRLLEMYRKLEWKGEFREEANRFIRLHPQSLNSFALAEKLARSDHNRAERLRQMKRLFTRNPFHPLADDYVEQVGEDDPATAREMFDTIEGYIRRWGRHAVGYYYNRAEFAEKYDSENARRYYQRYADHTLFWERGRLALAGFHERRGEKEAAGKYYRELRRRNPLHYAARRYLRLAGDRDPRRRRFFQDDEWDRGLDHVQPAPETNAHYLRKWVVLEVFPDMSYEVEIRERIYLANRKGIKAFSSYRPGRLTKELKTILPNGQVLVPRKIKGKDKVQLPGLRPGCQIERWNIRRGRSRYQKSRSPLTFYLQDTNFSYAYDDVRLLLVLPRESGLKLRDTSARKYHRETWKENGKIYRRYEARDMPRLKQEHHMPHNREVLPHVTVYRNMTDRRIADRYWRQIAKHTRLTSELRRRAAALTGDSPAPGEKARRLFDFVQDHLKKKKGGETAVASLLTREGSYAYLFIALLKAAGVPHTVAVAAKPDERLAKPYRLHRNTRLYRYLLVSVKTQGKTLWTHPDQKMPYGKPPSYLGGGPTITLGGDRHGERHTLPPAEEPTRLMRRLRVTLTLDGPRTKGNYRLDLPRPEMSPYKDRFEALNRGKRERVLAGLVNKAVSGAVIGKFRILNLRDNDKALGFTCSFKAPYLVQSSAGGQATLRLPLIKNRMQKRFIRESKRRFMYVFRRYYAVNDSAEISLGTRYGRAILPRPVRLTAPFGDYTLIYTRKNGKILVRRRLRIKPFRLSADKYDALVSFCRRIDDAESETLTLTERKP